jgi:predicted PurR-regulated permease PerM
MPNTDPVPRQNQHQVSHWTPETKRWAISILGAVLLGLVYYARSSLSWLVVAALLAYLLQPVVNWMTRHRVPRIVAVLISVFLAMGAITIIPILLMPLLVTQFMDMLRGLQEAIIQGITLFNHWLQEAQTIEIFGQQYDVAAIINRNVDSFSGPEAEIYVPTPPDLISYVKQAIQAAGGVLAYLTSWITAILGRLINLAFSLILLLFYTIYITLDGRKLKPWLLSLVEPSYLPELEEISARINRVWQAFFRGQLLLSSAIGLITFLGGLAIGLPNALVLGIIAGVLEVIPTLGPILAAIPAIALALIQGSSVLGVSHTTFAIITIFLYLGIQQLENALIVPKIMGKALELHPMLVIVGVVIGTNAAGILGAFLAAPTMATLKIFFGYAHAKILNRNPFPLSFAEEEALMRAQQGPGLKQRWQGWQQRWQRLKSIEKEPPSDKQERKS